MTLITLALACAGTSPEIDTEPAADTQDTAASGLDLRAWFADYDQGLGVAYLDDPGTHLPEGDPRIGVAHDFHQDVPYGPHGRTQLDLWVPESPSGLLIYFHGGGFVAGDRSSLEPSVVEAFLGADVAVATVNYRFAYGDLADMDEPRPQDEGSDPKADGTRLDYILRDCARSVQYLRHRDDMGVSGLPVVVSGTSAGGGCAAWIGAVDDLADAASDDPVLRESTRVDGVLHLTSQVTLDLSRWDELLGVEEEELRALLGDYPAALTQSDPEAVWGPQPIGEVLDYAAWWDASDPPLWIETEVSVARFEDDPLHHPSHAEGLYGACVDAGGDCSLRTPTREEGRSGSFLDFLGERLQ